MSDNTLNKPQYIVELPEENEGNEENNAIVLAPTSSTSTSTQIVVPSAKSELFFPHQQVMQYGTAVASVTGIICHQASAIVAPEVAERMSRAVEGAVKQTGEKMIADGLANVGAANIPGLKVMLNARVTDVAHKAGEEAYEKVMQEFPTQAAVVGSATAGLLTVVALEVANGLHYLYQSYTKSRQEKQNIQRGWEIVNQRAIASTTVPGQNDALEMEEDEFVVVGKLKQ